MPTLPDVNPSLTPQPWIQRNVLWLVGLLFIAPFLLYLSQFQGPLSDKQGTWGEFGDFMGGVINPIVGLCTVWLLTVSLSQNQIALQHTRDELVLAREALAASNSVQQKTEQALIKQILVSEHARDINNASVLFKFANSALQAQEENIRVLPLDSSRRTQLSAQAELNRERLDFLSWMMGMELERLKKTYPQDQPEKL